LDVSCERLVRHVGETEHGEDDFTARAVGDDPHRDVDVDARPDGDVVVEDAEVVPPGEADLDLSPGASAIHSPFTFLSDLASPDAHRGKFSGAEVKS